MCESERERWQKEGGRKCCEIERVNREGRNIVLRERERITILLRGSEGANKNEYKELGRYTIPKRVGEWGG